MNVLFQIIIIILIITVSFIFINMFINNIFHNTLETKSKLSGGITFPHLITNTSFNEDLLCIWNRWIVNNDSLRKSIENIDRNQYHNSIANSSNYENVDNEVKKLTIPNLLEKYQSIDIPMSDIILLLSIAKIADIKYEEISLPRYVTMRSIFEYDVFPEAIGLNHNISKYIMNIFNKSANIDYYDLYFIEQPCIAEFENQEQLFGDVLNRMKCFNNIYDNHSLIRNDKNRNIFNIHFMFHTSSESHSFYQQILITFFSKNVNDNKITKYQTKDNKYYVSNLNHNDIKFTPVDHGDGMIFRHYSGKTNYIGITPIDNIKSNSNSITCRIHDVNRILNNVNPLFIKSICEALMYIKAFPNAEFKIYLYDISSNIEYHTINPIVMFSGDKFKF